MAGPLSKDLRERIVAAVEAGASRREAAERFSVSASCAVKLVQRWRRTGSVAPGQMGGQKRHALAEHGDEVRALVAGQPDATLEELRAGLAARGLRVGRTSVHRFLRAIGLTRKKSRSTPPSRPGRTSPLRAPTGRADWKDRQGALSARRLVFVDETWTATNMARRHGRSPRGRRLVAGVPHGHWKTSTFLAALRADALTAPCVIDGAINGETFRAWVEQFLAPTLQPGDLVVMDNLGSHKVAGVREAIEARGAGLLYLPPYSPDFNPIEQFFAKLKALLRKAAARTLDALIAAIAAALDAFSPAECANYFANAGYVPANRNLL